MRTMFIITYIHQLFSGSILARFWFSFQVPQGLIRLGSIFKHIPFKQREKWGSPRWRAHSKGEAMSGTRISWLLSSCSSPSNTVQRARSTSCKPPGRARPGLFLLESHLILQQRYNNVEFQSTENKRCPDQDSQQHTTQCFKPTWNAAGKVQVQAENDTECMRSTTVDSPRLPYCWLMRGFVLWSMTGMIPSITLLWKYQMPLPSSKPNRTRMEPISNPVWLKQNFKATHMSCLLFLFFLLVLPFPR